MKKRLTPSIQMNDDYGVGWINLQKVSHLTWKGDTLGGG